jgi:hypothetical protein
MIQSAQEYFFIIENGNDEDYARIFEDATDEIWLEILKRNGMEEHVIKNNLISPYILDVLAGSQSDSIRFDVATKRRLLRETFEKLLGDPSPSVRHRVACNPKCPVEILKILMDDRDMMVAEAATTRFIEKSK